MFFSWNKGSNVKRHYEKNHKKFSRYYYPPIFQLRINKLLELESSQNHYNFIIAFGKEADFVIQFSFLAVWTLKTLIELDKTLKI